MADSKYSADDFDSALDKSFDEIRQKSSKKANKDKRKKSVWMKLLKALIVILLVIFIAAAAAVAWGYSEMQGRGEPDESILVEIPMGASTSVIAQRLKNVDAIDSTLLFRLYSREMGYDGQYQYGKFEVNPSKGYEGIIKELMKTASYVEDIEVTIPEGWNTIQIAERMAEKGFCTAEEFIDACNTHVFDYGFLADIPEIYGEFRLEGYLYPDTYSFFPDDDVDTVINKMLANFEGKVVTEENTARKEALGYTWHQLVSLAAIVQGESYGAEVMYDVASVFYNRLQPGSGLPLLQSDTTNTYIREYLHPYYGGTAPQSVVDIYDSYGAAEGIPAGVIGNPGLDAITATLNPSDTDYYYFVTDIEYTYYFATNYSDHQKNINKALAVNKQHGMDGLVG